MRSASRRNSAIFSVRKNCLAILVGIALTSNVCAQQPAATAQYAIPSGDLIQVVNEISRSSGFQIVYDIELLKGKHAVAVAGSLSLQQAFSKRSEEHTSELQALMRNSYAAFCLKKNILCKTSQQPSKS